MLATIFDLDIGNDPDDTFAAIMVALNADFYHPVLFITNDETETHGRAKFLSYLLAVAQLPVPVAAGLPSLKRRTSSLVEAAALIPQTAVDFIEDGIGALAAVLDKYDRVNYFGLGALTNLAQVLTRHPEFRSKIMLTQMGPALYGSYRRDEPQYNARIDPASFHHVLSAVTLPRLLMSHCSWGAYPCGRQQLGIYPDDPVGQYFSNSSSELLRIFSQHLTAWVKTGKPCSIMHDPLTIISSWHDQVVEYLEGEIVIDTDGFARMPEPAISAATIRARISMATDYDTARKEIIAQIDPSIAAELALGWKQYNSR